MSRTRILIGVVVVLVVVGVLAAYLGRVPLEAMAVNRYIDVAGLQLNMVESEVTSQLGEGEYQYGFGVHGRSYAAEGLAVSIAEGGSLDGRVSELRTSNPAHTVYGVSVGTPMNEAVTSLTRRGFENIERALFRWRDVYLTLVPGEKADTVGSIIIGIDDPALKGVQF